MKVPHMFRVTLAIYVALAGTAASQPNTSILKMVGSYMYNTTETGQFTVKNYYISQRIAYSWIDSYMTCMASGMRMAFVDGALEAKNLIAIALRNQKLFDGKVFINGRNLTQKPPKGVESSCLSFKKSVQKKFEISHEYCTSEQHKFLCEDIAVVDGYVDPFANGEVVDVKATFFKYLGVFELGARNISYYLSNVLDVSPNNAPKICQAFDMNIASPQSQHEYEHLRQLLYASTTEWDNAVIAGYRSEEDNRNWVVSNSTVPFEMDWDLDEPNNENGNENCIAIKRYREPATLPKVNDIPCTGNRKFICEFDNSQSPGIKFDENGLSTFFAPLTTMTFDSYEKELFLSLHSLDWTSAVRACKNFAMELLTPTSEAEDEALRMRFLEKGLSLPYSIHIGASSTGFDNRWYAVHSGTVFNYDFEWRKLNSWESFDENKRCLQLNKPNGEDEKCSYEPAQCVDEPKRFVCQKITYRTNEIEPLIIDQRISDS